MRGRVLLKETGSRMEDTHWGGGAWGRSRKGKKTEGRKAPSIVSRFSKFDANGSQLRRSNTTNTLHPRLFRDRRDLVRVEGGGDVNYK